MRWFTSEQGVYTNVRGVGKKGLNPLSTLAGRNNTNSFLNYRYSTNFYFLSNLEIRI
ncbi:hypothetical protein GCM10027341_18460 [Spirosoma knui]